MSTPSPPPPYCPPVEQRPLVESSEHKEQPQNVYPSQAPYSDQHHGQHQYQPTAPHFQQAGYQPQVGYYQQQQQTFGYPQQQLHQPHGFPQQPGYMPVTSQPQQTTIIIQQPMLQLGDRPGQAHCPKCQQTVITRCEYDPCSSGMAWIVFLTLFITGFCIGVTWFVCWIPFCVDSWKNVIHRCPHCGTHLHTYKYDINRRW